MWAAGGTPNSVGRPDRLATPMFTFPLAPIVSTESFLSAIEFVLRLSSKDPSGRISTVRDWKAATASPCGVPGSSGESL